MSKRPDEHHQARGQRPAATERTVLAAITTRFGQRDGAVQGTFESSASFRGLCRDYLACLAALEHWQASPLEAARARAEEYSQLLAELAREIEAGLAAGPR